MQRRDLATEADGLLKRAHLAIRSRADALLAANGITAPQAQVLDRLWSGEAGCLRDLCAQLGTQPATLAGVLDGLEKRGLIMRTADPIDGRVKRLAVTEAGNELKERVIDVCETVRAHAFAGLMDEEIAVVNAVLRRVVRNLGESEIATALWEPMPT